MAAWGKPAGSSWADDVEKDGEADALPAPPPVKEEDDAFPSLAAAVAAGKGAKKKEKPKKQTLTLAEFTTGRYVGPGGRSRSIVDSSKGLTPAEMQMLPKGPRERAEGEEEAAGFRGYGGYRGGGDRFGDRGGDRGEREGGPGREERDMPSREDESSNWGADRKFAPSGDRGGRGGFGDRYGDEPRRGMDEPSKADEVDDWGAGKKFAPSASTGGSSFGGRGGAGFGERDPRAPPLSSRADEVDNWGREKKFVPSSSVSARGPSDVDANRWGKREPPVGAPAGGPSAADTADRWARKDPLPSADAGDKEWRRAPSESRGPAERPRLVLQKRTEPVANEGVVGSEAPRPKNDPFGGAKPRELVLKEKGVKPEELERTSSVSSTASSSSAADGAAMANGTKPRPNPFGEAKPREVLLEERGQDWRQVDVQLERKPVSPGEEEQRLQEEIAALESKLKAASLEGGSGTGSQEAPEAKEQAERELQQKKEELQRVKSAAAGKAGYAGAVKTAWGRPGAADKAAAATDGGREKQELADAPDAPAQQAAAPEKERW